MNDQTPAPPSQPAATPPPPPPREPVVDEKASGGMRALAVLFAIVLGFAAAIMIAVMVDLGSSPICEDVQGGALNPAEDCYDISSTAKPISLVLGWLGGVLGVIGAIALLRFAITSRGGRLAVQIAVAAIVLSALALAVG
jgi:hypothetical protein